MIRRKEPHTGSRCRERLLTLAGQNRSLCRWDGWACGTAGRRHRVVWDAHPHKPEQEQHDEYTKPDTERLALEPLPQRGAHRPATWARPRVRNPAAVAVDIELALPRTSDSLIRVNDLGDAHTEVLVNHDHFATRNQTVVDQDIDRVGRKLVQLNDRTIAE